MSKLLEAILLPDKVAICKCAAHTNDKSFISTGNARADVGSEGRGSTGDKETTCALVSVTNPDISPCLQRFLVCPKHFFQHYAKLTHGLDHVSKGSMILQMKELWVYQGVYSVC